MKKWKLSKKISGKLLFLLLGLIISQNLFSFNFFSPISHAERFNVTEDNFEFTLSNQPIIINSEIVVKDSTKLIRNQDYIIDYQSGRITFVKSFGNLTVEYQNYPADLKEKFYLFEEQEYTIDKKVKIPPSVIHFFPTQQSCRSPVAKQLLYQFPEMKISV